MRKRSRQSNKKIIIIQERLEKELERYIYYRHIIENKEPLDIHSFVWNIKGFMVGFSIPNELLSRPLKLEQYLFQSIAKAKYQIAINN